MLWLAALVIVSVGVGRAASSPTPIPPGDLSVEREGEAFEWVASQERTMREKSMAGFPSDAWSRDDDFAASERGRIIEFSDRHRVKREHVLRAFDNELRRGHRPADGQPVRSTVAPCKPRAMD